MKAVASVFNKGKSGCVRDVQFSPYHYFQYAAAFENGNIQVSFVFSSKCGESKNEKKQICNYNIKQITALKKKRISALRTLNSIS